MKKINTTRLIKAPLEMVFETIADVRHFSKAVPDILRVEFESEQQVGLGVRFKETREMNGRQVTVPLEIVEYEPNERVRFISDTGGTVWDTIFVFSQAGGLVEMQMEMEARAKTLIARIFNPLIRGMVFKGVESDMDAVKQFCESQTQ